jgi:hypothetical protein
MEGFIKRKTVKLMQHNLMSHLTIDSSKLLTRITATNECNALMSKIAVGFSYLPFILLKCILSICSLLSITFLNFFTHLFICAYIVWAISPPCPIPPPSLPGRTCSALFSNFVEEKT